VNAYDLPTSLTVGEVGYPIRYGWRAVVDVLEVCADPEVDEVGKAMYMLMVMFPTWKDMPGEHIQEALEKAAAFIDCGQKADRSKPKLIDWKQDASIIVAEINNVAKREIRLDPQLHWWTVFGWFMSIGEGRLAAMIHIRQKRSKRQKLEKWEQDFYRDNKALVDFQTVESEEVRREKDNILKFL